MKRRMLVLFVILVLTFGWAFSSCDEAKEEETTTTDVTVSLLYDERRGSAEITPPADPEKGYQIGETVVLTATPDDSHDVIRVIINGAQITWFDEPKEIRLSCDTVIEVAFGTHMSTRVEGSTDEAGIYLEMTELEGFVTFSDPANGKYYTDGEEVTMTIKPREHYHVSYFWVNGEAHTLEGEGSYTFILHGLMYIGIRFSDALLVPEAFSSRIGTYRDSLGNVAVVSEDAITLNGDKILLLSYLQSTEAFNGYLGKYEVEIFTMRENLLGIDLFHASERIRYVLDKDTDASVTVPENYYGDWVAEGGATLQIDARGVRWNGTYLHLRSFSPEEGIYASDGTSHYIFLLHSVNRMTVTVMDDQSGAYTGYRMDRDTYWEQ